MKRTTTIALAAIAAALTLPMPAEAGKGGGSSLGTGGSGATKRMERSVRPETAPLMQRTYYGETAGVQAQERIRTRNQTEFSEPQGTRDEKALGPRPDLETPNRAGHGADVPTDGSQE